MPGNDLSSDSAAVARWLRLVLFPSILRRPPILLPLLRLGLPWVTPTAGSSTAARAAVTRSSPPANTKLSWGLTPTPSSLSCVPWAWIMYSALSSEHDTEDVSPRNGNRLEMLHPSRLKAAVLEAGTSLTPASWQGKSASNQSRSPLPPHTSVTSDTSDSDADSTFTAPSGRLNPARSNSTPSVSGQARSIFRVSPASNRSPQASFRLKNFSSKGSATLAEDSVSLSNRSDSSSHQDHLADAHPQVLDCRPTSWSVQSACQPVHRSASRTRSPQRVAPAPGPSDGSISSATGRQEDAQRMQGGSPHLDIFEPRPVLSGGLEAVLGQQAESLGSMSGPELLTHMADGLPTGKTWLRGSESLPSPSCTQGPGKSRSVRKISCMLDGNVVSVSYSRKGFHGMMQKQATGTEQVVATVYRAQISPGEWHSNKAIMVFTNRGWLALHPLSDDGYIIVIVGTYEFPNDIDLSTY